MMRVQRRAIEPAHGLWLVVKTAGKRWDFLLAEGAERTIVIGGAPGAAVCLKGAPPVCLILQREGESVVLVPGYGGAVRLDAVRVTRPARLRDGAVIEFEGQRVDISVRAVGPHEAHSLLRQTEQHPATGELIMAQPADPQLATAVVPAPQGEQPTAAQELESAHGAPTVAQELEPVHDEPGQHEAPTVVQELAPESTMTLDAAKGTPSKRQVNWCDDTREDFEPATQIMGSVPDFEQQYPGYDQAVSSRSSDASEELTSRTEGIPFDEFVPPSGFSKAASPAEEEPGQSLGPASQQQKDPEPASQQQRSSEQANSRPQRSTSAASASAPGTAKPLAGWMVSRLEEVGSLAKKRPRAMVSAVGAALAVGLLAGAVVKSKADETREAASKTAQSSADQEDTGPEGVGPEGVGPKGAGPKDGGPEDVGHEKAAPENEKPKGPTGSGDETAHDEPESPGGTGNEKEKGEPAEEPGDAAEETAPTGPDPEKIARAVGQLMNGRVDEARASYRELAKRPGATDELRTLSRLLERRARQLDDPHSKHRAPEILR